MSAKELWQDYWFLTNEIEKFILRKDFDLVNELLMQREKLQQMLEAAPADAFASSEEGRKLIQDIAAKNRGMTQILHMLRNRTEKSHAVANAYDRLGMSDTGRWMDSKR